MNVSQALWEHLITKRKYNKKCLENDVLREELERKTIECDQYKRQLQVQQNVWEGRIIELEKKLSRKKGKNVRNTKSTGVKVSRKEQNDNK